MSTGYTGRTSDRVESLVTEASASDDGLVGRQDNGQFLTLPSELYWDYVKPFTPVDDRKVICKRDTTRYNAGDRQMIDAIAAKNPASLKHVKEAFNPTYSQTNRLAELVMGMGIQDFDHIDRAPNNLLLYRTVWDDLLKEIDRASLRLHLSLELLLVWDGVRDDEDSPLALPLLFPGAGTVKDIIRFHLSLHPEAISDTRGLGVGSPNGCDLLACVAAKEIVLANGQVQFSATRHMRDVIDELLSSGADVSQFFQRGQTPAYASIESILRDSFDLVEPDANRTPHHLLTKMSLNLADAHSTGDDEPTTHLDWLICRLGREHSKKHPLRFELGERVECRLGFDHWVVGIVTRHWATRFPYVVELLHDSYLYASAPEDSDAYIRLSPVPELRFHLGVRVQCNMGEGRWAKGTIIDQWYLKRDPYVIKLDEDAGHKYDYTFAPFDDDDTIRLIDEQ